MPAALLLNGVDAETYGFTLAEAPGWSDMPGRTVVTAPVIGRQGVKDLADPQEQPRKLSLRGMVRGSSISDARAKLDALKLALAAKPVQFTFADQPTRYVNGRLDSFTAPPLTGSLVHGAMPIDVTIMCSDPYFYDLALNAGVLVSNLALQSEDAATTWATVNSTISTDVIAAPDGFITADRIVETAVSGNHGITELITTALGTYTASRFFKMGERSRVVLSMSDNVTGAAGIGLDLATGLTYNAGLGVGSWTGITSGVVAYPNGYYRLWVTGTRGAGTQIVFQTLLDNGATISYLGDITKGLYTWGAQLVAGAVPGPYVKTLAAAASRLGITPGTATVRPIVTITGASVNPTITLFNSVGVAVASIALTITTVGGDSLVIDMDAKTVKLNGVSQIATITAGDFFSIDPADPNFLGGWASIGSSSGAVSATFKKAWR